MGQKGRRARRLRLIAMTEQPVRVERSGAVTTVYLHRPARRNAVDGPAAAARGPGRPAFVDPNECPDRAGRGLPYF
jgi:hypothetical protein